MIAPDEGSETNLATTASGAEARSDANGGLRPRIAGRPESWQVVALGLLQKRAQEAQRDLMAAVRSFEPEPGCSLVNGEWVKNG